MTAVVDQEFVSVMNSSRCVQLKFFIGLIKIPICIWLAGMIYSAYTPEHTSDIGSITRIVTSM